MTTKHIEEMSSQEEDFATLRIAINSGNLDKCKEYTAVATELCTFGQLILRGNRIVMPKSLRTRMLEQAHEAELVIVVIKANL